MPDEITEPTPQTSEGDDLNTVGNGEGNGTPTVKPEVTPAKITFNKEQQDEVNRIVATRLQKAAEKAKNDADEKAAIAAGEHEKLASKYKTERDDFEAKVTTLTEENEKLRDAVSGLVKAEMKLLPDNIRDLAPSEDPLLLVDWLPKARKSAGNSMPRAGNGEDPKPKGAPTLSEDALYKQMKESGRYRSL